jgi:hypothetical protein
VSLSTPADKWTPAIEIWWWIHLSRLAIRVMLQAAQKDRRRLGDPESWAYLDRGWPEALRRIAEQIAIRRAHEREPAEALRLQTIPDNDQHARAVFLRRWFPVPAPRGVVPGAWSMDELKVIARWLVSCVHEESTAWAHWPDGWPESLQQLRRHTAA